MIHRPALSAVLVLSILGLVSCGSATRSPETLSPLAGVERTWSGDSGDCGESGTDCARVKLTRLVFDAAPDDSAVARIDAWSAEAMLRPVFDATQGDTPEAFTAAFLDQFRKVQVEFPDYSNGWELTRSVALAHQDEHTVCMVVDETLYTGGAHGSRQRWYTVFRRDTGARLSLDDVLRPGTRDTLVRRAQVRFRALAGLTADQPLSDGGYWFAEDQPFDLTDNWGILAHGFVFYFNQYEIAPYSMGPTDLRIPREDWGDLVRAGGLDAGP